MRLRQVMIPVVLMAGVPRTTTAQAQPQIWERSLELSGNYLYGNSDQAIVTVRR